MSLNLLSKAWYQVRSLKCVTLDNLILPVPSETYLFSWFLPHWNININSYMMLWDPVPNVEINTLKYCSCHVQIIKHLKIFCFVSIRRNTTYHRFRNARLHHFEAERKWDWWLMMSNIFSRVCFAIRIPSLVTRGHLVVCFFTVEFWEFFMFSRYSSFVGFVDSMFSPIL